MKLLRNPEVKRFILISVFVSAVFSVAAMFFSSHAPLLCLVLSFVLITVFLIFTKMRYKRIEALTKSIDEILLGNYCVNFNSFNEGELSILENDVQKILLRLYDQRDLLQKEKQFLSDSIADISHQIKTPLTSINLILSLLNSENLTEERRNELLYELTGLVSKTEYLVSVLLKISKIDAGSIHFEKQQVSVKELLRKSSEPLMIAMDLKNQSLDFQGENFTLEADILWTAEALSNIIKNCCEHTKEGSVVSVKAEDTPVYSEIVIKDNGDGFDKDDLPHIFERFYKGKNSSENSFGIGMNLSKMILTGQNATVKAENAIEGGAKITVRFYKQVV